jgi:hypothetical protein
MTSTLPLPFSQRLADQRVVFENLQVTIWPEKLAAAVALEHRGDDAHGFAEFGFEFIAKIGGFEGHGGSLAEKKPCIAWLVEMSGKKFKRLLRFFLPRNRV